MFEAFLADTRQLDTKLAKHLGKTGMDVADSEVFAEAAEISTAMSEKSYIQEQVQSEISHVQAQVSTMHIYKNLNNDEKTTRRQEMLIKRQRFRW